LPHKQKQVVCYNQQKKPHMPFEFYLLKKVTFAIAVVKDHEHKLNTYATATPSAA
jgi:hypothetical protein